MLCLSQVNHLLSKSFLDASVKACRPAGRSLQGGDVAWFRWNQTGSNQKPQTFGVLTETDDNMRAFAEKVFASETKDENMRDEISMFDVADDCPIIHNELAHHLHTDDDVEKR